MWPVLIEIGEFRLYAYGVLLAAGYASAVGFSARAAPWFGDSQRHMWNMGTTILAGGLFGARFLGAVIEMTTEGTPFLRALFNFEFGATAGAFFGGLVFGTLFTVAYGYFQVSYGIADVDLGSLPFPVGTFPYVILLTINAPVHAGPEQYRNSR